MTVLAGAHALVTGGSEGIGLATAAALRARGARVSIVARDPERLAAARDRLGAAAVPADVTDPDGLAAAFAELRAAQGPVDVLVSCAGASEPGRFVDLDDGVFRRQWELNVAGTVRACRLVVPSMIERGRGHLVLLSSVAGFLGIYGFSAYAPTKFAVRGFGEALRGELAPHGVRVSIVYPPDTDTPGLRRERERTPAETAAISATIPPLPAERVAAAIVRGVERNRLHVTADPLSALLLRVAPLLDPLLRRIEDRTVRRVGGAGRGAPAGRVSRWAATATARGARDARGS